MTTQYQTMGDHGAPLVPFATGEGYQIDCCSCPQCQPVLAIMRGLEALKGTEANTVQVHGDDGLLMYKPTTEVFDQLMLGAWAEAIMGVEASGSASATKVFRYAWRVRMAKWGVAGLSIDDLAACYIVTGDGGAN